MNLSFALERNTLAGTRSERFHFEWHIFPAWRCSFSSHDHFPCKFGWRFERLSASRSCSSASESGLFSGRVFADAHVAHNGDRLLPTSNNSFVVWKIFVSQRVTSLGVRDWAQQRFCPPLLFRRQDPPLPGSLTSPATTCSSCNLPIRNFPPVFRRTWPRWFSLWNVFLSLFLSLSVWSLYIKIISRNPSTRNFFSKFQKLAF